MTERLEYIKGESVNKFLERAKQFEKKKCKKKSKKDNNKQELKMNKKLDIIDGESYPEFLRRAEKFRSQILEKEYDLILQFLNELLGLEGKHKLTSLVDFKRINHDDLLIDPENNKKLVIKYLEDFNEKLGMEMEKKIIKEMNEVHIITIIRSLLKKINYRLQLRNFKSGKYYYIKKN